MTVYKAKAKFTHVQPKFKIFYENGSTYSDVSGPLDRAHKQGVVAILMEDQNGQHIEKECDFYVYMTYGWVGVSQYGLYDYLASPGSKLVLFGRIVDSSKRTAIYNKALSDDHIKG